MGRSPNPINKFPFPDVWREISDHHRDDWEVRLRPAANLIGYFLFPIGWHWTEYKPKTDQDKMPYELLAREASNLQIPLQRPLVKPASTRRRAGQSYRKAQVWRYLQKILVRGEVWCSYGPTRNIALPKRSARPIERIPTREDFEDVRIDTSTVGRLISRQIDVKLDANELLDLLSKKIETRGAKPTYDLLKIERWCRDKLERNTPILKDAKNLRATLIAAACDWHSETEIKPAGPDQVRPIVNDLLREYGAEE